MTLTLKRAVTSRYVAVLLAAVLVLAPLAVGDQYALDVLTHAGIFILLCCGLNIVVGLAGLLDLGYIAFVAVGAYTAALLGSPHFGVHLPFLVILPLAAAAAALFAVAIGLPTLRLRGDYLAIVTLGFGEIVRVALVNSIALTGGPDGIQSIDRPELFGYRFGSGLEAYYILVCVLALAGIAIGEWIRRGRLGLYLQALRDDELAAKCAGIDPLKYYLVAFAIGAAYGGVGGVLFAVKQSSISPDSFTIDQSILVLAIVILGGLSGRFVPVAISAIFIVCLPELLRSFDSYRMVLFGPLLVLAIILQARFAELRSGLSRLRSRLSGSRSPKTDLHLDIREPRDVGP